MDASGYETTSDLNEQIYFEKLDADMLQAQFEAEGRALALRMGRVEKLLAEGRRDEATATCPHGHLGLLTGSCSEDDPRYGESGYRCYECGAVVSTFNGKVLHVR